MRRYLFPLILGVLGCAALIALGLWQLQRMEWKQAMLAQIQSRIEGPAVPLPETPDPSMKYMPVTVSGMTTGQEIDVLSGMKDLGGGYQVISSFVTDDGRRILLDRGFVDQDHKRDPRPATRLQVTGNLHWPDETSGATPAPNLDQNIWFARDVPAMAAALDTDPVLVVVAAAVGDAQGVTPVPVAIQGIPNNHLSYAVQWFMIAAVWAGMTVALIWRIRQRQF
ncbi:SURF1 family protein [Paracoccus shanxieyensis]|uniref:SURF1-like protein n=1 Tax=Paracoccus shanxieyensis TaxID=2675752 RepID=A0A6L6J3P8_9RHOB|nr:SURF1 family protein [Paracoccus shanxieyensis]MTH65367.1 SURF1 family protein [Paracoccus shanxieyensis]MTH88512.1 SURF1 family protein [Paracoccus shanxieyensis]